MSLSKVCHKIDEIRNIEIDEASAQTIQLIMLWPRACRKRRMRKSSSTVRELLRMDDQWPSARKFSVFSLFLWLKSEEEKRKRKIVYSLQLRDKWWFPSWKNFDLFSPTDFTLVCLWSKRVMRKPCSWTADHIAIAESRFTGFFSVWVVDFKIICNCVNSH